MLCLCRGSMKNLPEGHGTPPPAEPASRPLPSSMAFLQVQATGIATTVQAWSDLRSP